MHRWKCRVVLYPNEGVPWMSLSRLFRIGIMKGAPIPSQWLLLRRPTHVQWPTSVLLKISFFFPYSIGCLKVSFCTFFLNWFYSFHVATHPWLRDVLPPPEWISSCFLFCRPLPLMSFRSETSDMWNGPSPQCIGWSMHLLPPLSKIRDWNLPNGLLNREKYYTGHKELFSF